METSNSIPLNADRVISSLGNNDGIALQVNLEYKEIPRNKQFKEWCAITIEDANKKETINPDENNQPPMDFVFVIDVSGSMKADKKIAMVLSTIRYIIGILNPKHRIAIILFNDKENVITVKNNGQRDEGLGFINLTEENKSFLVNELETIKPMGSTNMSSALEKAVNILSGREIKQFATMFFLTDGFANNGKIGRELLKFVNELKPKMPPELVIHTFAFGIDHDSRLLQKISFSTKVGVYHYLDRAEMTAPLFAQCLASSLSTLAYNIELTIKGAKGCRIVNTNWIKFPVEQLENLKQYKISLGNLSRGESRTVMVKLSLNNHETQVHDLLQITAKFVDPFNNKEHTITMNVNTQRPKTGSIEEIKSDDDLPVPQNPFICEHFFRILIANHIDNVIQDLLLNNTNEQFTKAQIEIFNLCQKLNGATNFSKSAEGQNFSKLLQEMLLAVQDHQLFTAGIHYAHAFTSMLFLEKSSGCDQLAGLQKYGKDLIAMNQNFARNTHASYANNNRPTNPIYVTYVQLQQRQNAREGVKQFQEKYCSFYDN
jgi:hypothetical protein